MTWGDLFDRAPDDVAVDDVRRTLAERRDADRERSEAAKKQEEAGEVEGEEEP